jgi:hypothetical protein
MAFSSTLETLCALFRAHHEPTHRHQSSHGTPIALSVQSTEVVVQFTSNTNFFVHAHAGYSPHPHGWPTLVCAGSICRPSPGGCHRPEARPAVQVLPQAGAMEGARVRHSPILESIDLSKSIMSQTSVQQKGRGHLFLSDCDAEDFYRNPWLWICYM